MYAPLLEVGTQKNIMKRKHAFPKDVQVVCEKKTTNAQVIEIMTIASKMNMNCGLSVNEKDYPYIAWDGYEICMYCEDNAKPTNNRVLVTYKQFKEILIGNKSILKLPFKKIIDLSDGSAHKVEITKEGIKVGCQSVSHEKIKEIYMLSQEAQK